MLLACVDHIEYEILEFLKIGIPMLNMRIGGTSNCLMLELSKRMSYRLKPLLHCYSSALINKNSKKRSNDTEHEV